MVVVEGALGAVQAVLVLVDAFFFLGVVEVDHHQLLDVQAFYLLQEFFVH